MPSLVLELQQLALQQPCDFGSLLRHALVVATKLGIGGFRDWANQELNGYQRVERLSDLPVYRQIKGIVKCYNPTQGLWQDLIFQDAAEQARASIVGVNESVEQIQQLLSGEGNPIAFAFPGDTTEKLMRVMNVPLPPTRVVPPPQLFGILDHIRTKVLQWSMELEQQGIFGEGMTFTTEEKSTAISQPTINIQNIDNFQGIIGSAYESPVVIGDENVLHSRLSQCDIKIEDRQEFERIADELKKTTDPAERKSLTKRAVQWIAQHAGTLGSLSGELREWVTQFGE